MRRPPARWADHRGYGDGHGMIGTTLTALAGEPSMILELSAR
jgi:hypothetical protein